MRPHLREDEMEIEEAAERCYGTGHVKLLLDRLSEARADLARVTEQRDRARAFISRIPWAAESRERASAALADDPPKETP